MTDDESTKECAPGDFVDQTAPTKQAMQAVKLPDVPTRPRTVTNLELLDFMETKFSEQAKKLGDVNRSLRDLGNLVDDVIADQKKDRARIAKIEEAHAAMVSPRAPLKSLHSLEECDVDSGPAVSVDERFTRLERDSIRKRKSQSNQTITLVGAIAAAVVTIIGALTQLVGARAERGAKEGISEAVQATPKILAPAPAPPGSAP